MTAITAVREASRLGATSPHDVALHGWLDWAEWVEPIERSVAAVSASVLADRLRRVFSEPIHPWLTHVVVLVDVGAPGDADAASHFARVATMVELRAHFPFVDGVAALNPTRYAVLARRHPGLSGTLNSLEERLRDDAADIEGLARVWCEELPDTPGDVAAFVRGLLVKPTPFHQNERGSIAAGFPVEVLATSVVPASPRPQPRPTQRRWALRSAAAAVATATLMSAAGAAATVGVSSVRPLIDRLRGVASPEPVGAAFAPAANDLLGGDALSMFIPGFSASLVGDLRALISREPTGTIRPGGSGGNLAATPDLPVPGLPEPASPGVAPVAPATPPLAEPEPPPVEPPGVPEPPEPEAPGIPEAPAVPGPPPIEPVEPVKEIEKIEPDPGLLPIVPPLLGLPL